MVLNIYVPKKGSALETTIKRGSAIVGMPVDEVSKIGQILIYFEGNLYGAVNLNTIHDRAEIAAGRMVTRYPTLAHMTVPSDQLVQVGAYDYEKKKLVIDDSATMDEWRGDVPL